MSNNDSFTSFDNRRRVPDSLVNSPLIMTCAALILILFSANFVGGQELDPEADYRYGAVTWMQKSAEYRLLTQQTYRFALTQLAVGVHDRNWTADEYQIKDGGFEHKPPAVILDLDETVLDNSYYNARNIINGTRFTTKSWNAWCKEEKADAIPGALDFVKGAEGLGVKIFYLTNREDEVKEHTIRNLVRLGFDANAENVLTKNEDDDRGDDKLSRRAAVAKDYRIVLLIGDSMSDLCEGMDVMNTKRRNQVAAEKVDMLGSRWIMLPNPSYGSWQRALPQGEKALELKQ
jgi:acid phosphatase